MLRYPPLRARDSFLLPGISGATLYGRTYGVFVCVFCVWFCVWCACVVVRVLVFAIYEILFGWQTYKYYYETDDLPNPRPTQPKKN